MADLLECLLQIKGLRETARRVAALASEANEGRWRASGPNGASALDLLSQLVDAERRHGAWLRLMLASERPALPASVEHDDGGLEGAATADVVCNRFVGYRASNLALLDRCSAEQLSRTGIDAERHAMTVADLVAIMLANDADVVGQLRRMLR